MKHICNCGSATSHFAASIIFLLHVIRGIIALAVTRIEYIGRLSLNFFADGSRIRVCRILFASFGAPCAVLNTHTEDGADIVDLWLRHGNLTRYGLFSDLIVQI